MDKDFQVNKKSYVYYLFFIAIIILFSVHLIRFIHYSSVPIGYETYYHQRIANSVFDGNIVYNPFHLLIAGLSLIIGMYYTSLILPFVISMLTLWFLLIFLDKLEFSTKNKFYTGALFILSPIFILFSSTLNVYFFSLMLILAGFILLMQRKIVSANLLFIIAALSSVYAGAAIAIFLLCHYMQKKEIKIIYTSLLVIIVSILTRQSIPFVEGSRNILTNFIGDLGGLFGFNIYTIILFLIGAGLSWKLKYKLAHIYVFMFIMILVSSLFNLRLNTYLLIPVCIFATYGLLYFINRKWSLLLIKDLTMLILITGLVISTIGYIQLTSNSVPNYEVYDSLATLKIYAEGKGKVLSTYEKSEWIKSIAKLPVMNDFENKNQALTNEIFLSKNFNRVISLLKENKIRYIWLDKDLKEKFWPDKDYGLIFFMRNRENFDQVYENKYTELWKFLGGEE